MWPMSIKAVIDMFYQVCVVYVMLLIFLVYSKHSLEEIKLLDRYTYS